MIKILFFIPNLSDGGAEKVLRNLVNNMDQSRFDITVQTIEEDDAEKYLIPGIHYIAINKRKSGLARTVFKYWLRFCAEFKLIYPLYMKDNYDIEVAFLECGATKMVSSSTNDNALKLAWVHCDLLKKEGITKSDQRVKEYYRKYDKVICVSDTVRKSYVSLYGNKPEAVVLYNVNDEKEIIEKSRLFNCAKSDCKRIVSVGRLSKEKGFDRLIEACNMLKKAGYALETIIIGEGNERRYLESLVEKYRLEETVKLIGFVENPYPYMKSADIVVCSSLFEGFSTVVTESIILGKTVITTPCAGMYEILGDSEYGIIAEDSAEGIFEEIKSLLDSEEKRIYYEKMSKKRGKEFSKEILVRRIEEFFEKELINKRR